MARAPDGKQSLKETDGNATPGCATTCSKMKQPADFLAIHSHVEPIPNR
jgi:hypothetical protein